MGLKIDRKQDKRVVHACTHMLADIPNGVTVCSSELVAGGILQEGTALGGKDAAGLYHVVKTARLTEDATANTKAYKVAKGHHFKVGDFIMLKVGAKAYKITSIVGNALRHHQRRHYFRRSRHSRRSPCTCRR